MQNPTKHKKWQFQLSWHVAKVNENSFWGQKLRVPPRAQFLLSNVFKNEKLSNFFSKNY